MHDGRFAISIHILTLLACQPDCLLSSELIGGSININPVLVRKELGNLRKHGMVSSKEGKNGGTYLAKPASHILLSDVYQAVRSGALIKFSKNDPNPRCPIGQQINKHLEKIYDEVEQAMLLKLSGISLADFSKQFN